MLRLMLVQMAHCIKGSRTLIAPVSLLRGEVRFFVKAQRVLVTGDVITLGTFELRVLDVLTLDVCLEVFGGR